MSSKPDDSDGESSSPIVLNDAPVRAICTIALLQPVAMFANRAVLHFPPRFTEPYGSGRC
jgi:hypothetical protein